MNDNPIAIFIVIALILVGLFIDYRKHRCPKCKTWHPFSFGLIILDKPCEKWDKEWVKCKKCRHEWEIAKARGDHLGLGGE